MNKKIRFVLTRIIVVVLAVAMIMSTAICASAAGNTLDATNLTEGIVATDASYFDQYGQLKEQGLSEGEIKLLAKDAKCSAGAIKAMDGKEAVVFDENNSWCEWTVNVAEDSVYSLTVDYLPNVSDDDNIVVSFAIDGKNPFRESASFTLARKWASVMQEGDYPFEIDPQGDDIRPERVQLEGWISSAIENTQGLYTEPYLFSLTAGTHTIRLEVTEATVSIGALTFKNEAAVSYKDYVAQYEGKEVKGTEIKKVQAETAASTNSVSLYPSYDKNDAATEPSDPANIRLNTIGGAGWATPGDVITWNVNVEEAGLYRIAMRAKQSENSGMISYRSLQINGETPFAEAREIPFEYSPNWKMVTLGDENGDYLFWLEPGDTITLKVTSGKTAPILRKVQGSVGELNAIYRQILAITSATPDIYQDYGLETKIPNLEENLRRISKELLAAYDEMCELLGNDGSLATTIMLSANTLEEYADKPYEIPEGLSSFKSAIENLGSLILSLGKQPLALDYIAFMAEDAVAPKAGCGFFKSLSFSVKQFLSSFSDEYSTGSQVGGSKGKSISLWVTTGRDQAQILTRMISTDFTEKTGIDVNVSLVDTGQTLQKAALSGKGPDIALMIPQGTPVELAARGALVDLTPYITEDVYDDFNPESWVPFRYQNKVYALPESQGFQVMFYRTDILKQLGIKAPDTWDELYDVLEVLQSNNLSFGILEAATLVGGGVSSALEIFGMMLMQKGGMYYVDDLSKTQFDTEAAYQAFTEVSRLYTDFGLDRSFDFYTRFRSGEMPIAITGLVSYAQIQEAAPEIRGLWSIAPLPGTKNADGVVERYTGNGVTGCIMLKAAKERGVDKDAYEFLKWWVSTDAQKRYSTDLENTLGVAGRYYSANVEAFLNIDWSAQEREVITEQRRWMRNQPQVIGNYAVTRDLTSALRSVISGENRPRRALLLFNADINEEINRKREEFGLND